MLLFLELLSVWLAGQAINLQGIIFWHWIRHAQSASLDASYTFHTKRTRNILPAVKMPRGSPCLTAKRAASRQSNGGPHTVLNCRIRHLTGTQQQFYPLSTKKSGSAAGRPSSLNNWSQPAAITRKTPTLPCCFCVQLCSYKDDFSPIGQLRSRHGKILQMQLLAWMLHNPSPSFSNSLCAPGIILHCNLNLIYYRHYEMCKWWKLKVFSATVRLQNDRLRQLLIHQWRGKHEARVRYVHEMYNWW